MSIFSIDMVDIMKIEYFYICLWSWKIEWKIFVFLNVKECEGELYGMGVVFVEVCIRRYGYINIIWGDFFVFYYYYSKYNDYGYNC